MKHTFENLIEEAGRAESLSVEERAKMRALLVEYMAFKPMLPVVTSARVSWVMGIYEQVVASLRRPALASAFGAIMLSLSFGGLAYAAEGTLPGDPLYAVKVGVTEPLRTFLAFSAASEPRVHTELAERRLDEASTLASEGKLSSTTEMDLIARFSANAVAVADSLKKQQEEDPLDAAVSAANFSAQLEGHEAVLARIDSKHHANTTQLRSAIRARIAPLADVNDQPATTTEGVEPTTSATQPTAAYLASLEQQTTDELDASAGLISSASGVLDASSSANAEGQYDDAVYSAGRGRDLLASHDNRESFRAFRNSLSAAARLKVLARGAAKFGLDTFEPGQNPSSTTVSSTTDNSSDTEKEKRDRPSLIETTTGL